MASESIDLRDTILFFKVKRILKNKVEALGRRNIKLLVEEKRKHKGWEKGTNKNKRKGIATEGNSKRWPATQKPKINHLIKTSSSLRPIPMPSPSFDVFTIGKSLQIATQDLVWVSRTVPFSMDGIPDHEETPEKAESIFQTASP